MSNSVKKAFGSSTLPRFSVVDSIQAPVSDYDSYINCDALKGLAVSEYLDRDDVYLTPNMTYKPRMMRKPKNCVVNGSLAILIPKKDIVPTDKQMEFFSTRFIHY